MTEEQKENIEISNRFLGYGDPSKALIYFFGIEEGGEFNEKEFLKWKEDILKKKTLIHNQEYFYQDFSGENEDKRSVCWPTEGQQAYLAFQLIKKVFLEKRPELKDYLDRYYISEENKVFCSNVFPLGSSSERKWPEFYKVVTSYVNKNDYYEYSFSLNRPHDRKSILTEFIKKIKNDHQEFFIFIMGQSAKERLNPILEKEFDFKNGHTFPSENEYILRRNYHPMYYKCSACKRIWYIGHPSNGWFDERVADRIIEFLKK